MTKIKLKDLPEKCSKLIESIELILVNESLIGSTREIKETKMYWKIFIQNLPFPLEIPKDLSEFRPAFIKINKEYFVNKGINMDNFINKMKENNISVSKIEPRRGFGYITMGNYTTTQKNYIAHQFTFSFIKQEKLYDFYLICKKYNVF